METQKWEIFSKSSKLTKLNFVRTPSFHTPRKKSPWLRQYQSYISNWYVNVKVFTSTTTWEPKNLIFFSKKFEIEFDLYFDLCWRAEIIQVGLNMHLYVDIGDASSSLWGSTSSSIIEIITEYVFNMSLKNFWRLISSLWNCLKKSNYMFFTSTIDSLTNFIHFNELNIIENYFHLNKTFVIH